MKKRRPGKPGILKTSGYIANLLGIDQTSVLRMAKRGALPGHKIGKVWRFDENEVLKATKYETPI